MIVVSDTSPLRYLVLIGEIDLLHRMFGKVHCPIAVIQEGRHERAPEALRTWLSNPPSWLIIDRDPPIADTLDMLDAGESAAIALAEQLKASILLMDERKGRKLAVGRGLKVAGTINILAEAAAHGWIDFSAIMSRLRSETNFRISDQVAAAALAPSTSAPNEGFKRLL